MIYHVGFLVCDRERDKELNLRAHKMMRDAAAGRVHLMQRRLGHRKYEYHAVPTVKNDWWAENARG